MMTIAIKRVNEAIKALKRGELVIVADDKNREHEGDLIGLAAFVTPTSINQMLKIGRGLICVPMASKRAQQLDLPLMTAQNTEKYGTQFTVSVDHVATTTGVSAFDRATTIRQLANLSAVGTDFEKPGHVFPLVADDGGILARQGHTEAGVELAKIAGVPPVAYIVEILNADGTMAREAELAQLATRENLQQLNIADIVEYRQAERNLSLEKGTTVQLPTEYGDFTLTEYANIAKEPDLLLSSTKTPVDIPLVRIHSECATGDVFGSKRCECGPQLHQAMTEIGQQGGNLIYLRQEGRGIGLSEKLKAYVLQEQGFDTFDANVYLGHQPDERNYEKAAQILQSQGINKIKLMTNNPEKVVELEKYGIEVVERIPLVVGINSINQRYIDTKIQKFNHSI